MPHPKNSANQTFPGLTLVERAPIPAINLKSVVNLRLAKSKYARLTQLAASRHSNVDHALDELATIALMQYDLILQFLAAAGSGDPARGLALLDKLERQFGQKSST